MAFSLICWSCATLRVTHAGTTTLGGQAHCHHHGSLFSHRDTGSTGGPVAGYSPVALHGMVWEVLAVLSSLQRRVKSSDSCKQSFPCDSHWESCFERLGFGASLPWHCVGMSVAQSPCDQSHGGHPAQGVRVNSARQNLCTALGNPGPAEGVDEVLQVPGADTHQYTWQTQLQPCFTWCGVGTQRLGQVEVGKRFFSPSQPSSGSFHFMPIYCLPKQTNKSTISLL